jgi:hypothetical protein
LGISSFVIDKTRLFVIPLCDTVLLVFFG